MHHKEPDMYIKHLYDHASLYGSTALEIKGVESLELGEKDGIDRDTTRRLNTELLIQCERNFESVKVLTSFESQKPWLVNSSLRKRASK